MASKVEANSKGGKRKQRYLPHNKPVKKKGTYPLTPGIEGFFITCDGGREHQAAQEALSVIDSYFEDLVDGKVAEANEKLGASVKVANKKITFTYSDSSDDEADANDGEGDRSEELKNKDANDKDGNENEDCNEKDGKEPENFADDGAGGKSELKEEEAQPKENVSVNEQDEQINGDKPEIIEEPPAKKQCFDTGNDGVDKAEKSVDKLIEAELQELADKTKRRFLKLDSGCNGVVIIKMKRQEGAPGPKEIVQHMMESAASTRKHVARYLLRVLPIEVSCYSSEEEISRAIKPIITKHFPVESENAIKTVCLIGVVEKYKELAKFNIRQLISGSDKP